MQIVNFLPTKNAEIHKVSKVYEVRLFNFNQYEESFYCRKKLKNRKNEYSKQFKCNNGKTINVSALEWVEKR